MADEKREDSYTDSIFISEDNAWEIINNQIIVQEQLRKRGQQTLRLLSTLAAIVVGTSVTLSVALNYNIWDANVEDTASSLAVAALDLRGTLFWNSIIIFFILTSMITPFLSFLFRNYSASRHISLQPNLGGRKDNSIRVTADYRNIIGGKEIVMQQYETWIKSNDEKLADKRQQLDIANIDLSILIVSTFLIIAIHTSIINRDILILVYIDFVLLIVPIVFVIFVLGTRDEPLRNWRSLPFTEQQKERFPFLRTVQFWMICLTYTPIFIFSIYVCKFYIQELLLW